MVYTQTQRAIIPRAFLWRASFYAKMTYAETILKNEFCVRQNIKIKSKIFV